MKKKIMKTYIWNFRAALAILALLILNSQLSAIFAQGTTAFTYQGQLRDNGTNANGTCTMVFNLYDSLSGGNLIGGPITSSATMANGLFTVNLDFGAGAFNGRARYLDITVTNGGETQELSPRVQVMPSPYALYAAVAATVTNGAITSAQLAANAVTTADIQDGAVSNQNPADNAVTTANIQDGSITESKIAANTTLIMGVETNLQVIRGSIAGDGTILSGSGFTVNYVAAGSGGTVLGQVESASGSQVVVNASVSSLQGSQWILIGSVFYQVQSASGNTINLNENYTGSTGSNVIENMTFYPAYTVNFNTPFLSIPTVLATAEANGGMSGVVGFSQDWFSVNVLRTNVTSALSQFQAVVARPIENININGLNSPHGFEFIAVGPQ